MLPIRFGELAVASLIVTMSACSGEVSTPIPEANDVNCKAENISRIQDEKVRMKLADKCFLRSTYKPSTPSEWRVP